MVQYIVSFESEGAAPVNSQRETFALDVLVGLSDERKAIPSIYHYDAKGSRLFNRITELPEYYLTRSELDTLEQNKDRIVALADEGPINLIEFGPGDGSKTSLLIEPLVKKQAEFTYVPIDISESALNDLIATFGQRFPKVEVHGLAADYFAGIKWINQRFKRRNVVLFLGSNIGNLDRGQARLFLRNLWMGLNDGDLVVIGFDLKKDIAQLLRAYNDSEGVTAQFNLNVLTRINNELGGNFNVDQFHFFGTYDVFSGAIESYLVSQIEQDVHIEAVGRSFHFDQWEPIHTEYSYKYLESDIASLASDTGFQVQENLYDARKFFVDSIWQVCKTSNNSK